MIKKYTQLFLDDNSSYKDVFDSNATMKINKNYLLGLDQIIPHFQKIKSGLSNINYEIDDHIFNSEKYTTFTWRMSAKHTGIFMSFLPTQNNLSIEGMTTLEFKEGKVNKNYTFYDEKELEDQICKLSKKVLNPEEIFNDLNGPSGKIYNLLLSTRSNLTDSKQVLVNALRKSVLKAPDMSLLNKKIIAELKENTNLITEKIWLLNREIELFIYTPKGEERNKKLTTILYLHGGGWCIGSPEGYDIPNRKLALTTNTRVICPRYRLCPEHPYPAGFDDCCDVYSYLLRKNLKKKEKIVVAGDSAGGGFAAALTLRMQAENQPLPSGLMLLSPATDMRVENYDSYNEYTNNNIMIDQGLIGFLRGCYIQGDMWDHPYVSPMRGDLSCFPKTFVLIGEDDPLYDENISLSNKISKTSKYQCDVLVGKGMPHHYHTFIGLAEEVERSYQRMSSFIMSI